MQVQDLMNSMVRFSAAVTLFSWQQLYNAMTAVTDSEAAMNKFQAAMDSVTDALKSQLDETNKPAMDSVSKLGTDMVDRTWEGFNVSALDPQKMMDTTADLMRKTTDSLTDWMKKSEGESGKESSGEPKPAAEVLAAQ